jgi:hypothetical protein
MRSVLIAGILAIAASGAAWAEESSARPESGAEHPPTNRMDQATPTMEAPGAQQEHAPTNRVDQALPPMKPSDPQSKAETAPDSSGSATAPATTGPATAAANEDWIGRPVYSSDEKQLGEVVALTKGGDGFDADIGGFLGLGESRVHISSDQIQEVKDDRIVLRLTEAEAKNLPAAPAAEEAPVDDNAPAQP